MKPGKSSPRRAGAPALRGPGAVVRRLTAAAAAWHSRHLKANVCLPVGVRLVGHGEAGHDGVRILSVYSFYSFSVGSASCGPARPVLPGAGPAGAGGAGGGLAVFLFLPFYAFGVEGGS